MANIKQQIKRNKTNEKRRLFNASFKSSVRTAIKAFERAVESKDADAANTALAFANKKLDKGLAKGIYHKNFVARNKSNLAKTVNQLSA
ncbi:MAG: 30S ribosomal protein S20 [Acholeplasmataceae bacterium]